MASVQFQRATTRRCIHRRKRIASTRLDGIRRTLCTGYDLCARICIPTAYMYASTTRSPSAPRHNLRSTQRSRAAELEESFVLPRITRTMHANRNGFAALFPPTMLRTSSLTSSLHSPLNANATDLWKSDPERVQAETSFTRQRIAKRGFKSKHRKERDSSRRNIEMPLRVTLRTVRSVVNASFEIG